MTIPNSSLPVSVVTGAARGIGLATIRWFLAHGHQVVMLDIDAEELSKAALEYQGDKRVLALPCDVSNPEQVQETMGRIEAHFGHIDALVNNAGVAVFKTLGTTSFEEWRYVMATNLDGAFLCSQACVPVMLKKFGTMGIRVNAIAPGPVETEMAKQVHSAAIRADYYDSIPLGRYGTMEEIASAVGFLCTPGASYVNGQVLAVDGGFDAAGVGLPTLRREAGGR